MKKAIVRSSHGYLIINYHTGNVIECNSDDNHLKLISMFNLNEYIRTYNQLDESYDILDLGYWFGYSNPFKGYAPPDLTWRKHIKAELNL